MAFVQNEKLFSALWFKAYTLIIIGSFILAAGFVFFINPYNIVPGGVYGIGIDILMACIFGGVLIIFAVVNRRELSILQEYIHQIDPEAFVTVVDANEILGEGFRSLGDKVSNL